eukprot:g70980.t1
MRVLLQKGKTDRCMYPRVPSRPATGRIASEAEDGSLRVSKGAQQTSYRKDCFREDASLRVHGCPADQLPEGLLQKRKTDRCVYPRVPQQTSYRKDCFRSGRRIVACIQGCPADQLPEGLLRSGRRIVACIQGCLGRLATGRIA